MRNLVPHVIAGLTLCLLATVADAQLHIPPPPIRRDTTALAAEETPAITTFSALAGSYKRDRAYIATDMLTGRTKGKTVFVQISAARVVSSIDTGPPEQRKAYRDRISTVTSLVNNGGQQSLRIGMDKESSTWRAALYGQLGTLGEEDSDEVAPSFDRVAVGAAFEFVGAVTLDVGQLLAGLRLGYNTVVQGSLTSNSDKNELPAVQLVFGARSKSGSTGMGVTLSFVPKEFKEYIPRLSITLLGFGR